jgi:hypothetical protein
VIDMPHAHLMADGTEATSPPQALAWRTIPEWASRWCRPPSDLREEAMLQWDALRPYRSWPSGRAT